MRIAVNTRLLLANRLEGLGSFSHEVLKRIVLSHPEHEFYFLFDRRYDPQFIYAGNVTPVVAAPQARHPFLYYLWFEWAVASALGRINPDLFLSPDGYLSLRSPVKQLPVIHDINFHHYPEYFDYFHRKHYLTYFPKYAAKAARIATVSEFSKQDIMHQYGIPAGKIDVVYNGVDAGYAPVSDDVRDRTRSEWTGGAPYFVFIGGLYPRKNLVRLIHAFEKFRAENDTDIKLVIIGSRNKFSGELFDVLEKSPVQHEIVITGRVDPVGKVRDLIASSLAMTYVSTFEGFGIPLLEAMRCGVPVITSNTSALPEVGGDVAWYVDPFSVDSIAAAMRTMAKDETLRQGLIKQGIEHSRAFTWDRTAALLWDSVEKTMNS